MTRRRLWSWSGPLLLLAWLALAHFHRDGDGPTRCLIRPFIGMPCPGCGMTRALLALGRGDLRQALAWHPLAPLVAAEALAVWVLGRRNLARGTRPRATHLAAAIALHSALFLALWAYRAAAGKLPW